jgi:outer membrane protein TolC
MRSLLALPPDAPVQVAEVAGASEAETPPTFEDALAEANASRPELTAAKRKVEIAEREVKAETAAFFPRVDAVGAFGNDSSNFELTSAQNSWAFGVAAELDLFSGFRTRERVQAAERRREQAKQGERRQQLEVEREVRSAYLTHDEARQRLVVAEAAVHSAEEALRLVQVQYSAGTVTITRYLEAEAARGAARSRAIAARYDLRRTEASLQKAMGVWARKESADE